MLFDRVSVVDSGVYAVPQEHKGTFYMLRSDESMTKKLKFVNVEFMIVYT